MADTPARPSPWSRHPWVFGLRSSRRSTLSERTRTLACGSPIRKSSLPPTASARRRKTKRSSFVAWAEARKALALPASLTRLATVSRATATLTPSHFVAPFRRAPVHELEGVRPRDLAVEADAARAEHAALGVEQDRPQVHHLPLPDLVLELHLGVVQAVPHVVVLQVALPGLVAYGAVDRVVDEEELEGRAVGLHRLLAPGADHHALRDQGVAGDLELRHLLDLDQAHAAVAVHRQVGVPAEVGDLDPVAGRRLDHRGPGGDLDLLAVDRAPGHGLPV